MSLIQEALKRQREEAGEAEPETASAPPIQTTEKKLSSLSPTGQKPGQPDASETEQESADSSGPSLPEQVLEPGESTPRAWPVMLGIGALLILLIGGIVWGTMLMLKKSKATGSQPGDNPPVTIAEKPKSAAPTPATPPQKPGPVTPKPEAVAAQSKPDVWPLLILGGVVGKDATGSAMINNEVVGVGEIIEGARVVAIANQGVTLEYKGKTMFLRVGASTR